MDAKSANRGPRYALLGTAMVILTLVGMNGIAPAADAPARNMKIGIIGTGQIGGTLAELWVKAGYEVMVSSRHPERLRRLAERLGPKARVGTPDEAAEFGGFVRSADA